MSTFKVTIRAEVTKTLTVTAGCEADAIEMANGEFSVLCEGDEEDYDQSIENVVKVD